MLFEGPDSPALLTALRAGTPLLWRNHALPAAASVLAKLQDTHSIGFANIEAAAALLQRWAPALVQLFPELATSKGLIESPLIDLPGADAVTGVTTLARCFVKADHALPVAGSVKARGGIYAVLAHAEAVATEAGLLPADASARTAVHILPLIGAAGRSLFAKRSIAVGSTGNLGLSIGIMGSKLGFRAVVHMSHDAKAWKKAKLREAGVEVIEHHGDYASAVAAGRYRAARDETTYFVDDENSRNLFLGYAVAALRLQQQLAAAQVTVDAEHPLIVHLPCGVGGAPGGVCFGLKHIFGDAVHCWFAEPCASPAMLLRMSSKTGPRSVYDLGLDNRTEADGLAVAQASELVFTLVRELIAGVFTVADDDLFKALAALHASAGLQVEPSAVAAFCGLRLMQDALPRVEPAAMTHLFWTTGGRLVPADEYATFLQRGLKLVSSGLNAGRLA